MFNYNAIEYCQTRYNITCTTYTITQLQYMNCNIMQYNGEIYS